MWSSEPQIIELVKGERGLGFSILDYQVTNKTNELPCFYPKDSIFSSGSSYRKSESLSENQSSHRSRNFSSSSKDSVFFSPIPKSSLQNPLRKVQKDQHVRFNFSDQGRRYLTCAIHGDVEGGPRSPASPWSGSEVSGTSSPSYTSNGEGGSRSPVVPFNYHIYI